MAYYNYLHHRRRYLRAAAERKRCRIQRRREQESYEHRHSEPERIQAKKSNIPSFNSTFANVSKGFRFIPSLGLYHR